MKINVSVSEIYIPILKWVWCIINMLWKRISNRHLRKTSKNWKMWKKFEHLWCILRLFFINFIIIFERFVANLLMHINTYLFRILWMLFLCIVVVEILWYIFWLALFDDRDGNESNSFHVFQWNLNKIYCSLQNVVIGCHGSYQQKQ